MGMYTHLVLNVNLHEFTPEEVVNVIKYMIDSKPEDLIPPHDKHELFETKRWDGV